MDRLATDSSVEVVVEPDVGDFVFFMKVEEVVELLLDIGELLIVWLILLGLTLFIVAERIGMLMFGQAAAGLLVHGLAVLDGLLIQREVVAVVGGDLDEVHGRIGFPCCCYFGRNVGLLLDLVRLWFG